MTSCPSNPEHQQKKHRATVHLDNIFHDQAFKKLTELGCPWSQERRERTKVAEDLSDMEGGSNERIIYMFIMNHFSRVQIKDTSY